MMKFLKIIAKDTTQFDVVVDEDNKITKKFDVNIKYVDTVFGNDNNIICLL